MTQYIDKAAVVAEIEDWRDKIKKGIFSIPLTGSDRAYATFEYEVLGKVRDFIDKHQVKEVDLEKEYEDYVVDDPIFGNFITNDTMGMKLAKHFFELGLKAQKGE